MIVDRLGRLVLASLTAGNAHDMTVAAAMLHRVIGRVYSRFGATRLPHCIIGDRAYDADSLIEEFSSAGIEMVIPARRNRRKAREIDKERYRNRNQVERFFNRIKNCRRIATRYEKTARNYLAFVLIAAHMI